MGVIANGNLKFKGFDTIGLIVIIALLTFSFTTMFVPVSEPQYPVDHKYDTMDKCQDTSCYQFGLTILLFFIACISFYSFERSFPIIGIGIMGILAIASISTVFTVNKLDTPFEYVKFITIIVSAGLLMLTRVFNIKKYTPGFISGNLWSWGLWLLLAINIGEAVIGEFMNKSYINPLVGIWLILFMPNPFNTGKSWKNLLFVDKGNYRDLVYKTPMFWVTMYILWDANYAYSEKSEHFAAILAVLLFPLLTGLPSSTKVNPYLFVQMRALTLFLRYIILGFNDVFEKYTDSTGWYNEEAKEIWDYINIALVSGYTIYNTIK